MKCASCNLQLLRPDSSETSLLDETRDKAITLLCLAFRSGAEVSCAGDCENVKNLCASEGV